MRIRQSKLIALAIVAFLCLSLLAGCGGDQGQQQATQTVPVKVMKVIQKDTPLEYIYPGEIKAKQEVVIQANVTGQIVAKMVNGGEMVRQGQPLFKIDSRQYQDQVLSNQANLAQAQANLKNAELDAKRYNALAAQDAISKQTRDTQNAVVEQQRAVVNANKALLQHARENLNDTVIRAPISGKLAIGELSVGNFVTAGATQIGTISSIDPVYVEFNMSENEYLHMNEIGKGNFTVWGQNIKLQLSDGSTYQATGKITEVNRNMSGSTGSLSMKAVFSNANGILIPGMFGRLVLVPEVRKNAILVPQRAVQQVLDKTFITVVTADNKAESRPVTLGTKAGELWVIDKGLKPGETIVVEGLTKIQPGVALKPTTVTLEQLGNKVLEN